MARKDKTPFNKEDDHLHEGKSDARTHAKEHIHHLGKKSNGVLQHEFYNLMINWNPNLYEGKYGNEKTKYLKRLSDNVKALKTKGIFDSILTKYQRQIESGFHQAVLKVQ